MADNISDDSGADVSTAFSSGEDREQLKQAILECTRAEVVRALNDILGRGQYIQNPVPLRSESTRADVDQSSPAPRLPKQRPQTVDVTPPGKLQEIDISQRPKTSHRPASQTLPLESVDCKEVGHVSIDRSSFNLLERSSAIVSKATGEPPTKFNDAFRDYGNPDVDKGPTNDTTEMVERDSPSKSDENDSCGSDSTDGMQRVDSWPERIRPTTATKLIHTSHLVLKNKPSKRRPLTTTALERRKPPPSTAASERSKAHEFSKRLLGPITLEPKRANYDFVIPNSLAANEWENELARNIINVFSNKARYEIKGEPPPAVQALPPMIDSSSLFADEYEFRGEDFMPEEGRDFQRISMSRDASCINKTDNEFFVQSPEKERVPKAKKAGKEGLRNGTFRLKMIWFTGTGMVRANWEAINEVDHDYYIDCEELPVLEEQGRYMRYVGTVESSISRWNSKTLHHEEHSELKQNLWRQLIVTCNCFATRLIEKRKYSKAMEMLEKTVSFIGSELGFLPEYMCKELTAMVKDTYAYYYIRRSKPSASYQYLISAINIYKRRNDTLNIAKCRLHQSFIQCAQHKYSDSMKSLRKILTMVENGALDVESDYNQVLLLSSVAYHNIAVQQLMLGHISDACVSSQNARRLARLCLSVSSHYLPMLESTHKQSLNELSSVLKNSHCEEQASLFHNLISELFE